MLDFVIIIYGQVFTYVFVQIFSICMHVCYAQYLKYTYLLTGIFIYIQSVVRLAIPLTDLRLCVMDIRDLDARQRFRLGVGLAKLGLFDLSLKHVWMVAVY